MAYRNRKRVSAIPFRWRSNEPNAYETAKDIKFNMKKHPIIRRHTKYNDVQYTRVLRNFTVSNVLCKIRIGRL